MYCGDKSTCVDKGLDQPDTAIYLCPCCGKEKEVIEVYDWPQRMFFPVKIIDIICSCGVTMDRKKG